MKSEKNENLIGYARVSTYEQTLDLQMDALEKAGCGKIFTDKISGMKDKRPGLDELLSYIRPGDTLVVYKLDRLGRSTRHFLELTEYLENKGIKLKSIQDDFNTDSAMGKAMFRLMAVLNEMERDLISERTKAGLVAARARGRNGGRPKKSGKDVEKAIKLYKSMEYSLKDIEEMTGVSKATLYRKLNEMKSTGAAK